MPAPTNISFATAEELGALPATVNAVVDDAGTTYTVYYKFTAPISSIFIIGAWAFGDLSVYKPTITPYDNTETQIASISAQNVPIMFPITAGEQYYIKVTPNGGNPTPANLELNVQLAPNTTIAAGDFMIIGDEPDFPATVFPRGEDYTVRRFVDIPYDSDASSATNLANGNMLTWSEADNNLKIRDINFDVVATPAIALTRSPILNANRTLNAFVVVSTTNPAIVTAVGATGTLGNDWSITETTALDALCINNDETLAYYTLGVFGAAVKSWNLLTDTAGAQLAAGVTGYRIFDILMLTDGTILVGYISNGAIVAADYFVRRYNAAGTILNTYSTGINDLRNSPRINYDVDHPDYFAVWGNLPFESANINVFRTVKVSDGTIPIDQESAQFDEGPFSDWAYAYTTTATPVARFGSSNSCPFLVIPDATPIVPGSINKLVPGSGKTNDTILEGTDVAIPNPFFITAPIGD